MERVTERCSAIGRQSTSGHTIGTSGHVMEYVMKTADQDWRAPYNHMLPAPASKAHIDRYQTTTDSRQRASTSMFITRMAIATSITQITAAASWSGAAAADSDANRSTHLFAIATAAENSANRKKTRSIALKRTLPRDTPSSRTRRQSMYCLPSGVR
jgi:hypothetical protein